MLLICFTVVVFFLFGDLHHFLSVMESSVCQKSRTELIKKGGGHVYLATIRSAHYVCIAMLIQMFLMRETLDASVGLLWA